MKEEPIINKSKFFIDLKNPRCPSCNIKLYKRYEGLVCKNRRCGLYNKLERGWVFLTRDSGWSRNRQIINSFFDSNSRLRLQKKWNNLRVKVIRRDDYCCQKCDFNKASDFCFNTNLVVHHIIPASEEAALYLDEENCITLCERCHAEVHKEDKYSYSNIK